MNKMKELIEKLNYYRNQYYNYNNSIISDREYDELYDKLVQLEEETGIVLSNSPTQEVGYPILKGLNKVTHSHKMLSLEKTKDINILNNFKNNKECVLSLKMDGLTILLTYNKGKLIRGETRGNGIEGQDVTDAVKHFVNIPLQIPYQNLLEIEGEAIIKYNDFNSLKDKKYSNPRNLASGSLSLLNTSEIAERKLTFIAWKVVSNIDNFYENRLNIIKNYGFTIVPFITKKDEITDLDIKQLKETAQKLYYPIDGLVLTYNDIQYGLLLGETAHAPKHSLAYKFYDEEYETILQDIEWTMGRTGVLTPVAIFEPIDIEGTEVSRANLHNISVIRDLFNNTPKKGQKIYIYKANQIIPQISKVEQYNEDEIVPIKNLLMPPEHCPICGHTTELFGDNNSIFLRCGNPSCEGLLLNRIEHFFSKKGLNAKGLSKATIEKLIDWGWANEIRDVFTLSEHADEWKKKTGFGEKSVMNIIASIRESCNTDLESVISAAGIPLIGRTVAKQIASIFNTYEDFKRAISSFDFSEIDGFGCEMNKSLKNYNYNELDYIVNNFLTINNKIEENKEQKLEGKTFCVTGKLNKEHWKNRDELSSFIASLGGKVVSAMSPNVDYLINNDTSSNSAKNLKAKELGKPIINEQMFIDMFDL